MSVLSNLFVFNHFSMVLISDVNSITLFEDSLDASLKTSNKITYSSRCNKSIKNFFRFVSVAVKNCKLAFVFWYTS